MNGSQLTVQTFTGSTYLVNDIYPCIQGEGVNAGLPMVLLRLHGCDVGCPWCDTKHTWFIDEANKVSSIEEALGDTPLYVEQTGEEIAEYVSQNYGAIEWVLITGGEPSDQPLWALSKALGSKGFKIALETSGVATGHMLPAHIYNAGINWVTVSPKIAMPGGRRIILGVLQTADEIKHVVGRQSDIDALDKLINQTTLKEGVQICLQPVSQSTKATQLCIKTVMERGWRLSLQTHKFIEER